MGNVKVFRFKVYDIKSDGHHYSTRMATRERIGRIDGGTPIAGTEVEIDESLLVDGWTAENFDPS